MSECPECGREYLTKQDYTDADGVVWDYLYIHDVDRDSTLPTVTDDCRSGGDTA